MRVSGVTVNGVAVKFGHVSRKLFVYLPWPAAKGAVLKIVTHYSGTPGVHQDPSGRGDVGWTRTPYGIATYDEVTGTSEWMPVNDVLYDKATWDVVLRSPSPFVGASTGALAFNGTSRGLRVTRWIQTQPITPYQQMVAFDHFALWTGTISGIPAVIALPKLSDNPIPTLKSVKATFTSSLNWLTARLGKYPYPTTGIIIDSDSGNGMETAGRITVGNDSYTTSQPVIVHELAHEWFAGRQTARTIEDLWLHEGFATWIQEEWQTNSNDIARAALVRQWYLYDGWDPARYDQFGKVSVAHPTSNYQLESTVYYRGAAALEALHSALGDAAFWNLLSVMGNVPAGRTTTTQDWVAAASKASGVDLSSWADTWLYSKDIQTLPAPVTTLDQATEEASGIAQELRFGYLTTITPQDVLNLLQDDEFYSMAFSFNWAPWTVRTFEAPYTAVYQGTDVVRFQMGSKSANLYGGAQICVTLPKESGAGAMDNWLTPIGPGLVSPIGAPDTVYPGPCSSVPVN